MIEGGSHLIGGRGNIDNERANLTCLRLLLEDDGPTRKPGRIGIARQQGFVDA